MKRAVCLPEQIGKKGEHILPPSRSYSRPFSSQNIPLIMPGSSTKLRDSLAAYGSVVTPEEIKARLFKALEINILGPHNIELYGYFETMAEQIASPYLGAGEDDAISTSSDDDLEQTALLFCHHDADGDGVLNHDEFSAVIDMVAARTGMAVSDEHIDKIFAEADVDGSGVIDFNELCLYRQRAATR